MTDPRTAAWLRPVLLGADAGRLTAHEAAAGALAAKPTPAVAAGLVRLAVDGRPGPAYDALSGALRAADSSFAGAPDDLETRLSACVAAAAALGRSGPSGAAAAHSVMSAAWSGLDLPAPELAGLADAALAARSEHLRARTPIIAGLDVKAAAGLAETFPDEEAGLDGADGRAVAAAITATVVAAGKALERLADGVSARLLAGEEEADLLWWAFAGRSDALDVPWPDVKDDGLAALAAAAEFASHLRYDVQPPSTRAILGRVLAGRAGHAVRLADAAPLAEDAGLPAATGDPLLPVLCSCAEASSFDGDPAWKASVGRWSIDPERQYTALDLAEQAVREILLARVTA